ncbi:Glycerol kinase [Streptomyces violaceorubidus]
MSYSPRAEWSAPKVLVSTQSTPAAKYSRHGADDVGPGQVQDLVAPLQLLEVVQAVLCLEHGAHGAVGDHHAGGEGLSDFAGQLLGAMIGAVLVWIAYYGQFQAHLTDREIVGGPGAQDPTAKSVEAQEKGAGPVLGVFSTGPEIRRPPSRTSPPAIIGTSNNLLLAILTRADDEGAPVVRPMVAETTCPGAAYAAGLAVGFWNSTDDLRANWRRAAEWTPRMDADTRDREYKSWLKAVERTMGWLEDEE